MTDQTDRIKQMAQEAGFSLHSFNAIDGDEVMAGEYVITDDLAKFAALVAEDCARVAGRIANAPECNRDETRVAAVLANSIRARYAIAKRPEAG